MELIGLDVGFSATKRTSALATLLGSVYKVARTTAVASDRKKLLEGLSLALVTAIDAPILPVLDWRVRACEQLFARGRFQRRCKPGFSHVPGTGRDLRRAGIDSVMQLQDVTSDAHASASFPLVLGSRNVVEAFPNAFLGVCVADAAYVAMPKLRRGRKFDWLYDQWCNDGLFPSLTVELASVLPASFASECQCARDHEERAAFVCLATAACVAAGRYTAVGEEKGGYFFLPPLSLWAAWARTELDTQRQRDQAVNVWIDGITFPTGMVLA